MSRVAEGTAFDVLVVGAGPAGSAASIELARRGRSVALCDRARFPRDKTCGDGLTTGALRRLDQLGLRPESVASFRTVGELAVQAPSGRKTYLPFRRDPGVFAAVARRVDLDAALLERARVEGATAIEGARFVSIAAKNDDVVNVRFTDHPEIRARVVVAADGAWSEVRRSIFGKDPLERRPDWMAWRGYVNDVGTTKTAPMWVWFDRALLPGYGWSFPLPDGTVNVGVATPGWTGRRFAEAWRSVVDGAFLRSLTGSRASLEAPARAWPIPARLDLGALSALDGRVLFVGDAAGAADPFTGEGIGQALETGIAASHTIADHWESGQRRAAVAYREAIAAGLAKDHALSRLCRGLFSHPISTDAALRAVDSSPFIRRNVARWLFEDYPRAFVTSPERWKIARRRAPGAFASIRHVSELSLGE